MCVIIFVNLCVVHVKFVLKGKGGVGHQGNASLETRGWLPWKPRAELSSRTIEGGRER